MKGYIWLFLVAAAVLLILPLPMLPGSAGDGTSSLPEDTLPPGTSPGDTTSMDTATQDTFRVLCGEEVVTLTAREFLIRTLAFEMTPSYHQEALKAQAVAAYTYYGRRRQASRAQPDAALKGADFATPDSRFPGDFTVEALKTRWGNQFDGWYNKLCSAVDGVLGKTITYEGQLIDACYFAVSNGSTESAQTVWGQAVPYLVAVASPGDALCPDYETTVTLTVEQVRAALLDAQPSLTLPQDAAAWFGQPTLSAAGTVTTIPVGNGSFTGTALRQALGLRSATFAVAFSEGQFRFTVKGYGHGVGMSQYGADYLARQGYTWQEIVQYYYKGITIS